MDTAPRLLDGADIAATRQACCQFMPFGTFSNAADKFSLLPPLHQHPYPMPVVGATLAYFLLEGVDASHQCLLWRTCRSLWSPLFVVLPSLNLVLRNRRDEFGATCVCV
jgi:hypothetical protein